MRRLRAIVTGCDIFKDPDQNTASHQALVDRLVAETTADGWEGVKVTHLETRAGSTFIAVEPGIAALTLDYLRALKRQKWERPADRPDPQLSLV